MDSDLNYYIEDESDFYLICKDKKNLIRYDFTDINTVYLNTCNEEPDQIILPIANCITLSWNKCVSCRQGYYLKDNVCYICEFPNVIHWILVSRIMIL